MTETERRDWSTYRETGDVGVRNRLVERHLALVYHFAHRMRPRTGERVEVEDLVSAGAVGLMQAVSTFDPEQGSRFSTFAAPRIRGAMLDEMRTRDVAPRSVRRRQREMERARERLAVENDRTPGHPEVAQHLGLDPQQLWRWKWDVARSRRVSLTELLGAATEEGSREPGETMDVEARLSHREQMDRVREALETVPARERDIIELYDLKGWTLRAVGERLGVSASRVSQLRSRTLARLRQQLTVEREAT
jgi:RNA polymerase sigma factor for flagellar operon FliA